MNNFEGKTRLYLDEKLNKINWTKISKKDLNDLNHMDMSLLDYDKLEEVKTDILDALDYYSESSQKHNDLYFILEDVYAALREKESEIELD